MSQLTTLKHATPKQNLLSIQRTGIDPDRSRGKMKVSWLHAASQSQWKVPHVANRHGIGVHDILLIKVRIPRAWIRRRGRGCWTCDRLIPPRNIVSIQPVIFLA